MMRHLINLWKPFGSRLGYKFGLISTRQGHVVMYLVVITIFVLKRSLRLSQLARGRKYQFCFWSVLTEIDLARSLQHPSLPSLRPATESTPNFTLCLDFEVHKTAGLERYGRDRHFSCRWGKRRRSNFRRDRIRSGNNRQGHANIFLFYNWST